MSMTRENKKIWRITLLAVGVASLLGPWTFDLMWVPAEYTCSAPNIRLDSNYCGLPLSWIKFYSGIAVGFISTSEGLAAGVVAFNEWVREFLYVLLLALQGLPLFITLLLVWHGDHRRWQVLSIVAWGLAAGMALLIGLLSYPKLFWILWGLWLYVVLAVAAVVLEVLALAANRELDQAEMAV